MKVIFAKAAETELIAIAVGIAEKSPARAKRIIHALRLGCEGLANMPRRFQLVPGFEDTGVRRRVVEDYLIFYSLGDASVEILHIIHGAMDYSALFLISEP